MSENTGAAQDTLLPRHAKGKRPLFYEVEGLDQAMSMILVLASELNVVQDRLDTVERVAAAKGVFLKDDIESFEPDEEVLNAREARRQDFLGRLYYLAEKQAAELASGDDAKRYEETLTQIAEG